MHTTLSFCSLQADLDVIKSIGRTELMKSLNKADYYKRVHPKCLCWMNECAYDGEHPYTGVETPSAMNSVSPERCGSVVVSTPA